MTELERLQKEINGKVIWWRSPSEYKLVPAICIWPPNGEKVSIKPYGITPEEINNVYPYISKERAAMSDFCFSAIRTSHLFLPRVMDCLRDLALMPDNGVFRTYAHQGGSNPSCPYGG